LLEAQTRLTPRDAIWLPRLDSANALYDEMVKLELDRGHSDQAFAWSERAREQALRSDGKATPTASPTAEVARDLGDGVALVSFALLDDRVVAWRLDHRGTRLVKLDAEPAEVSRAIAA